MKKKKATRPLLLLSASQRQMLLVFILLFTFVTRIVRLQVPDKYIFDEVYHAVTAKLIAKNDPRAFEWWNPPPEPNTAVDWLHPPLAKYTQATFINMFGENALGWRFSSVLFGVGVVWLTYRLATEIFENEEIGLLAAGLASLDGLLLAQSRIAMNDIHVTFFILLTLLLYWKHRKLGPTVAWLPQTLRRLVMIGLAAGLALASKWSGLFVIAIIGLFEAGSLLTYGWELIRPKVKNRTTTWGTLIKTKITLVFTLLVLPVLIYVTAYTPMFLQGKTLFCNQEKAIQGICYFERFKLGETVIYEGYVSHFVALHKQIFWYQTHLEATHPYESRPWQWFFNLKPVWVHVDYVNANQVANIYAAGNTLLFWFGGASILFCLFMISFYAAKMVLKKSLTKNIPQVSSTTAFRLLFIVVSYGMVWLPWVASPRIMFFYHYTPAVPLLCISLAFCLWQMIKNPDKNGRIVAGLIVGLIFINFVIWFPHWTGIPVAKSFADQVYFALKTWR